MRVNERMKKVFSILLCLCMVLQYVPTTAFAVTTDNLCEHHTEHTAECGYTEAVEAHECHYECAECAAAAASEEAPEESSNPAPVCTCAEACTTENFNEYCDVCGFDYTACTGTDTAAAYAEGDKVSVTINGETTYYTSIKDAVAKANESGNTP